MKMRKIKALLLVLSALLILTSCAGIKDGSGKQADMDKIFNTVCSADEALALAKSSGVVVIEERGCTSGKEIWNDFYKKASEGKPASVLCAHYYILDKDYVSEELYEQEKDLYPRLFFYMLKFDGKKYSIDIRMSTSEKSDGQDIYDCLNHYTGDAPTSDALYERYDYYVLTDDPNVTWDEITRSMLDSSTPEYIRHCTVYDDFEGWKGK